MILKVVRLSEKCKRKKRIGNKFVSNRDPAVGSFFTIVVKKYRINNDGQDYNNIYSETRIVNVDTWTSYSNI